MPTVGRRQIESVSDPESKKPWYEFDVDLGNNKLTITQDADGGGDFDISGQSFDLSNIDLSKEQVLAVTETGELVVYEPGTDVVNDLGKDPLRAHLAWWYPDSETVEVMEFAEFGQ